MRAALAVALSCLITACVSSPKLPASQYGEVSFEQLAPNVWMHTSHMTLANWGDVRSNGLIVVTGDTAILIDTAWDNAQTESILDWSANELDAPIVAAVFTHAHDDKMGGSDVVIASGAATYAHPLSNRFAPAQGLTPAEYDLVISENGEASLAPLHDGDLDEIEVLYPGPGHTPDNLVVGIPSADVLFGGCLVRPGGSTTLGNTATANIGAWAASTRYAAERFPDSAIIVPSHGPPAGRELLEETIALAEAATATR